MAPTIAYGAFLIIPHPKNADHPLCVKYVFEAANCGCGVSQSTQRLACSECFKKMSQETVDCSTEGCGEKRHGDMAYCKSCRSLNDKRPMTCFLCGGETNTPTRKVINAKAKKTKKAGIRECTGDTMGCFRRCKAYEGGVRGGEGGNNGRCQRDRFMKINS